MDFTNIQCISEQCKNNNVKMDGAGGSFGGRITISKHKCPVCGTVLMIIPMSEKYEYSISATTKEERIEQQIKKAKEESELALAKRITQIQSQGN